MMAGKIKKRRKERIAADKWVVGERLTKAGRERGRRRRTLRKAGKVLEKGGAITTQRPQRGSKEQYKLTAEHKKALGKKQRIRKGAKEVTLTKGGAYAKYGKKSGAAKSFRKAFKKECAGGAKTFSWDGRSYSCAVAKPAKKAKPAAKAKAPAKRAAKSSLLVKQLKGPIKTARLADKALKLGLLKKAPAPKGKKKAPAKKAPAKKAAKRSIRETLFPTRAETAARRKRQGKKVLHRPTTTGKPKIARSLYQRVSGGKTGAQHREARIKARRKKSEAARKKRRSR